MTDLHKLMEKCQTKGELLETLQPSIRQIVLEQTLRGTTIEENIELILSMMLQAVEQHGLFIEFQMLQAKDRESTAVPTFRKVRFPHFGKPSRLCQSNTRNLAILLTLLKTIQERFSVGVKSTVRDVFYSNVELYRTQRTVSYWLKNIATNFKLNEINLLQIIPAQKGLVYSTISLQFNDRLRLKPGSINLIPYMVENSKVAILGGEETKKLNVRIFEKEAIFNKFVQNLDDITTPEVIITGKGYPDNLTKLLVKKLNSSLTLQDLLIYVDADPYGINIALSYFSNCAYVDRVKYKGITIFQLLNKGGQLLSMSQKDYSMARTTLSRINKAIEPTFPIEANSYLPLKQELQRQLYLGKKGEMNAVYL